jgi:hypothetical protein
MSFASNLGQVFTEYGGWYGLSDKRLLGKPTLWEKCETFASQKRGKVIVKLISYNWENTEGEVAVKELDTEMLVSETDKLLRIGIDELYATLGAQLLVFTPPTRAAGIMSYLSAVRSASEATLFLEGLSAVPSLSEWGTGLGFIYETLKAQGQRYLTEKKEDLRKALCNQDILAWSGEVNRSTIQILITIVGATLRMPRELDSISATTLAIILKLGLRNFCS